VRKNEEWKAIVMKQRKDKKANDEKYRNIKGREKDRARMIREGQREKETWKRERDSYTNERQEDGRCEQKRTI